MSSVLGNASFRPRAQALKSSQIFYAAAWRQDAHCALPISRPQNSVRYIRHDSALQDDQSSGPRPNYRLGDHLHESRGWFRRLRRRAKQNPVSSDGVKSTQTAPSVAPEPVVSNAVNKQNENEASHPKHTSRSHKNTQGRKYLSMEIFQRNMLHLTLYRSFPQLNYEYPAFPTRPNADQISLLETNTTMRVVSLPGILQQYLAILGSRSSFRTILDPNSSEVGGAIGNVFDATALSCLSKKGYSPNDVMVWAWILTAEKSYRAALRLFIWESQHPSRPRAPLFVVKLLMYRASLDIRAFRLLLSYSLSRINQQAIGTITPMIPLDPRHIENTSSSELQGIPMDAKVTSSLVKLLLRKARQLWPAAQLHIAQSFAYYLVHQLPLRHTYTAEHDINTLRTQCFNECLSELAIPSRHSPFISTSIQQKAQFELLKAMATHEPVLPVSRQGYQSVVAVQLSHKKTPAERIYSAQKAPSWPPWKELKMGIDTYRGNEGMKSRTMQALSQMKAAGYSHSNWEAIASILAGWDTDGSPTIQTRSLAIFPKSLKYQSNHQEKDSILWSTRIRATRTLREAWACFLSYQNIYPVPSERVYHAIAKKIIYSDITRDHKQSTADAALPGDGLEVFPEPSSARDVIYVPTQPPPLEDLLKEMTSRGIRPKAEFISLLLRNCLDFSTGMRYINTYMNPKQKEALLTIRSENYKTIKTLKAMDTRLFDSFIVFLCSHMNFDDPNHRPHKTDAFPILMQAHPSTSTRSVLVAHKDWFTGGSKARNSRALSHAVQLLKTTKPRRVSAWLPLLKTLASARGLTSEHYLHRDRQWILAWYEILEVLKLMTELELEPGMEGLTILCQVFSHAVSAGVRDITTVEEGLFLAEKANQDNQLGYAVAVSFEDFVYEGLRYLKSYFDRLVYAKPILMSEAAESPAIDKGAFSIGEELPEMLQVPSPATLHALVRALGVAEDNDGVLNLLQWMSRASLDLKERSNQLGNGERMMRRTLTAVRVFLEGSRGENMVHRDVDPQNTGENSELQHTFSDGHVQEAYNIIEATKSWGSWPSDAEVREYCLWQARLGA
ncbi:hypothetical protein BGW36DRAFT_23718 [Talaromyces proteolyticus]|uniref:Uncharacterized protein n=1 Tax=Talaromyces proteolyticus TaxID=1131652 RepID=A0AAD4PT45_9EURO|nr:uncharacterized protein BGW36DRAFT_23718 [Talaromyces proteolyticus]KAH8692640.1 hypothetical protein BGW36DRAFT_23718 [Talaromyces proteolyticus]